MIHFVPSEFVYTWFVCHESFIFSNLFCTDGFHWHLHHFFFFFSQFHISLTFSEFLFQIWLRFTWSSNGLFSTFGLLPWSMYFYMTHLPHITFHMIHPLFKSIPFSTWLLITRFIDFQMIHFHTWLFFNHFHVTLFICLIWCLYFHDSFVTCDFCNRIPSLSHDSFIFTLLIIHEFWHTIHLSWYDSFLHAITCLF